MREKYEKSEGRLRRIEDYVKRYCILDKEHREYPEVTLVAEHCMLYSKLANEMELRKKLSEAETKLAELTKIEPRPRV